MPNRRLASLIGTLLLATPAFAQLQDGGLARRASLGVALAPDDRGTKVTAVTPGSAADTNGIRSGDVITAIDGAAVRVPGELIARVARHAGGETVRLDLLRDGLRETRSFALGTLPRETLPGVTFEYGAVTLSDGSRLRTIVSRPDGVRARRPAVFLVTGGGCGSIDTPLTPDLAQPGLVRAVAARDFVTMRVEKSGVGDSTGPPCAEIGYQQELEGYRAALAALMRDPGVDTRHVFLLGVSLGGLFAPVLAAETPVQGIVAYGTISFIPTPYPGRSDRFFREVASLDLAGAWSSVSSPVLVLHGQFDESTSADDAAKVAAFVNARHPGRATHTEFEGLDHCWTRHPSMEASRGHCGSGQPVSTLADAVIAFLRRYS